MKTSRKIIAASLLIFVADISMRPQNIFIKSFLAIASIAALLSVINVIREQLHKNRHI